MKIIFFVMVSLVFTLDLLEVDRHKIIYEFSYGCGNSYLVMKKIIADINNELKKNDILFSSELAGKKNFSGIFNIYEQVGRENVLLATNDKDSKLFQPVLKSYPTIFINSFEAPKSATEEEIEARKQLIYQLIKNLNKN
jgi:hypothetical protein